jgi:hypothetical protein
MLDRIPMIESSERRRFDMNKSEDSWIKRNALKLYSAFIILILILLCASNVWDFVSYNTGEKTEATVTEVVQKSVKSGARKTSSYKATIVNIKYSVNGTEYAKKIKLQGWYKLKEGDSLKVSYSPKNPEKVIIPQRLYQGLRFDILWGIFVGVQLVIFYKMKKKRG